MNAAGQKLIASKYARTQQDLANAAAGSVVARQSSC